MLQITKERAAMNQKGYELSWDMINGSLLIMPANNKQKEYIDIPLNIEQTPLHLFQKLSTYELPNEPLEIGLDLITRIDNAIRSQDSANELLSIYINHYEHANATKMADKEWPAVFEIETKYEESQFNAKVQALYNELRLRGKFQKARKGTPEDFLDVAEQAWENYESILERQSKQIAFPPLVAWDIFQNFLSQLSLYHELLPSFREEADENVFSLSRTRKLLDNLVAFIPVECSKVPTSKQTFGYFALLAIATIEVYQGRYKEGLAIVSRISLQHLSAYSRAIGALLSLFLTVNYAYFMLEQYKQSARVAEMVLLFMQKNKKYFAGAIAERMISRHFERLAGLLCINYIFLEEKPKAIMMQILKMTLIRLKDKQTKQKMADKYYKLKQNDQGTFIKLYQHCALPTITTTASEVSEIVLVRFKSIQNLTLHTILQHYTQISVAKIAKMLKITQEDVLSRIESFNNISTGSGSWDRTIMEPLLSQTRKLYVEVSEGVVKLDTDETNASEDVNEWQQYREEISWLVEKVDGL